MVYNIFIPSVRNSKLKINKQENVLLLINNASAHLTYESFEREYRKSKVWFSFRYHSIIAANEKGVSVALKKYTRDTI